MNDAFGVYKIVNSVTGKTYVGCTVTSFSRRWGSHIRDLNQGSHHNQALQNDWKEYGDSAFEFIVLEKLDRPAEVLSHEQDWINSIAVSTDLYNAPTSIAEYLSRRKKEQSYIDGERFVAVSASEFPRRLRELYDLIESGTKVVVFRNNNPCAVVVKFSPDMAGDIDWSPFEFKEEGESKCQAEEAINN